MVTSSNGATNRVWVDTVSDLNQYKPSQDELEARKLARKSNNKLLAKVGLLPPPCVEFNGEPPSRVIFFSPIKRKIFDPADPADLPK